MENDFQIKFMFNIHYQGTYYNLYARKQQYISYKRISTKQKMTVGKCKMQKIFNDW